MRIQYFPDLSSLFTELSAPPPVAATSVAECASYAFSTADTGTRATGFALRDGTCTLGRPPQFLDDIVVRPALTQGEDGVYANIAKPTSNSSSGQKWSVLSRINQLCRFFPGEQALGDMDWFFLINEEKRFEVHPELGSADLDELYSGTRNVAFPGTSPVQTIDGIHSMTFLNKACIVVCNTMHA